MNKIDGSDAKRHGSLTWPWNPNEASNLERYQLSPQTRKKIKWALSNITVNKEIKAACNARSYFSPFLLHAPDF
jgi:hypothetical protein